MERFDKTGEVQSPSALNPSVISKTQSSLNGFLRMVSRVRTFDSPASRTVGLAAWGI